MSTIFSAKPMGIEGKESHVAWHSSQRAQGEDIGSGYQRKNKELAMYINR